jgi:hypothetical protein
LFSAEVAYTVAPRQETAQLVFSGLFSYAALMEISVRSQTPSPTAIIVSFTLMLMVVTSIHVGQRLAHERHFRGPLALTPGTAAVWALTSWFPEFSRASGLAQWLRLLWGLPEILEPIILGGVFGLLSGLIVREQSWTQALWGVVVLSGLYLPYMFIEGVPLIFPVLPFVAALFGAGVLLAQTYFHRGSGGA